jgi:hypothetical protein
MASDLISRKALLEAMDKEATEMEEAMCIPSWATAKHCIKAMPTVDAVEVVRCKDCEYLEINTHRNIYYCRKSLRKVSENGFCSDGAKMDGGDKE